MNKNSFSQVQPRLGQFQQVKPSPLKFAELMSLQGQCKIKQIILLRLSIIKAIFLTFLAAISIVGVLMLIWFKWFRIRVWFTKSSFQQATHLYIKGSDDEQIQRIVLRQTEEVYFYFHKLKYRMDGINGGHYPVAFNYEQKISEILRQSYLSTGLKGSAVDNQRKQFGYNQHLIQIPNYLAYMLDVLLKPFFLIQYVICLSYFLQGFFILGILNLIFSLITTTINYILTYISYRKIKQMAEKVVDVRVWRDSTFETIKSNMLVPGDLIDPTGQIMCDCILVKGDIYVNQSSLTGQNIPIGKFSVAKQQSSYQNNNWLFEGSHVIDKRGTVLALVVYTGYLTRRGRIIRKILTKQPTTTEIFKSALNFFFSTFLVSMVLYFSTISFLKSKNVSDLFIGFRFVDSLGWAFPPTFPIYFNTAYSYTLVRLKNMGILCTEPQKTVQASNMKIMCFDKTGTLTQKTVKIHQIFKIDQQHNIIDITSHFKDAQNQLIRKLFATCHTAILSQGQLLGDQIDVRMFLFSPYQLQNSLKENIKFEVINNDDKNILEVLRVNQFQSKFQSMSVLVRDTSNNKIYVFIKGAPEKFQSKLSINFDKKVKSLSLGGYRTIAFGYKEIPSLELSKYLEGERDLYQNQVTLLGIVAFNNKLKEDSKQTINRLLQSGIEPKIITGDNIYITIETGIRTGIMSSDHKIIIIQGKKQPQMIFEEGKRVFRGVLMSHIGNQINQEEIKVIEGQNIQNFPIVVDNNFLKIEPTPILTQNMKLFARISPENKALIISKLKEKLTEEYNKQTFMKKLFGQFRPKIGMCGDGANDLMAIRSSDVGIGIQSSDARYAAMFSIKKLLDVQYLVRDSKATVANIVEMILYIEWMSFIRIPASLLMLMDTSYFNGVQTLFYSFASAMWYPIFMPMSKPSKIITKLAPKGNLFGLLNHLKFWGSLLITIACLAFGYFYLFNNPQFIPNPQPFAIDKWYPRTHSATCIFLMILFLYAVHPFIFYNSSPWKQSIWKNYFLSSVAVINIIVSLLLWYFNQQVQDIFGFVPISNGVVQVLVGILIGGTLISFLYNKIMIKLLNTRHSEAKAIDYQSQDLQLLQSLIERE